MQRLQTFWLTLLTALAISTTAYGSNLTIMTEEYPPFNYTTDNGQLTGFSTEVVQEIMKRLEYKQPIEVLPWSRAYNLTKKLGDTVLFSMTRNDAREDLFKWVGPLVSNKSVFWGLADKEYDIKTLEDAKQYKIGAYKDDADEIRLKDLNFPHVESVVKDELNLKKLLSGKIDLWIGGDPSNLITAKQAGAGDKIKRVYTVEETFMYIAFHKDTPDEEIQKWQTTLDALKEAGFYDLVWKKYFQ